MQSAHDEETLQAKLQWTSLDGKFEGQPEAGKSQQFQLHTSIQLKTAVRDGLQTHAQVRSMMHALDISHGEVKDCRTRYTKKFCVCQFESASRKNNDGRFSIHETSNETQLCWTYFSVD